MEAGVGADAAHQENLLLLGVGEGPLRDLDGHGEWWATSPEKALKEALGFSPKGDVRPYRRPALPGGEGDEGLYKKTGKEKAS